MAEEVLPKAGWIVIAVIRYNGMMSIPSRNQAEKYLQEAQRLNPGVWVDHSRYAGQAAELIARRVPGMDPQRAYIVGLLHDIGRRAGVCDLLHVIHGYQFLLSEGFPQAARICLTHSYLLKDAYKGRINWDGSEQQLRWLQNYLDAITYDEYDCLIQLCDGLASPTGFWLIEKRLVDVALRRGISEYSALCWKKMLDLKEMFEEKVGGSIYALLPGVIENTFGWEIT